MYDRNTFNDRLEAPSCRSFSFSHTNEGSVSALLVLTIALLKAAARTKPDGRNWLAEMRLELFDNICHLYSADLQPDELKHALDAMDLATGCAWGQLSPQLEDNDASA
ncbi:MAG: hypothetical protein AAGC70_11615 [Pseudomonadota bacterium]